MYKHLICLRLPRGKMTVKRLTKLVGVNHPVQTIDVATQVINIMNYFYFLLSPTHFSFISILHLNHENLFNIEIVF